MSLISQDGPAATASWEEVATVAAARLREQPIVLVPSLSDLIPSDEPPASVSPIQAAIAQMQPPSDSALLGLLLPASLITSRRHQGLRAVMTRQWQPAGVVYSTGALPELHASEQLVLLYLRARSAQSRVHAFRVPRTGDMGDLEKELTQLLALPAGATPHGYVMSPPWAADVNWRFDPSKAAKPQLADRGSDATTTSDRPGRTFGDLFERVNTARKEAFPHLTAEAPGAVRLLRFRDFSGTGTLVSAEETDAVWAAVPPERQLQAGDIVMQSVLHESTTRGPAVAVIDQEDLPAALEGSMNLAFRLKQPVEEHYLRLLAAYLNSPVLQGYAVGATIRRIGWKSLETLPLPAPDEAVANALDDLDAVRQRTLSWHGEANLLRQSTFTGRDHEAARQRIITEGRMLRLRVEAAAQLDDSGYIYRTTLPYPIAMRWRNVEAKASIDSAPGPAYQAALDTAEILFCFCALVAAALTHHEGVTIPRMAAIRSRLSSGGTAPGFGDWVAVLQELPSAIKHLGLPTNHPLTEFASFGIDQDVLDARVRLYALRNDESHIRRADELDLPGVLQTALADLRFLLERALFLADLPLVHVTSVRWDSLRKSASVEYHRLIGDHPIVPISTSEQHDPGLEVGSLYIIDSERRFHLLRPFLMRQLCQRCRAWSTFHIDRLEKQEAVLKSLEHGHSLKDSATRGALQHVGLLEAPRAKGTDEG
ncbi:restriction endonuclease [Streptomyces cavourensis]|uniref:restriction endonuclease n=1 Tax=Streptomyces cavourensis TaxID=67258 RepID=UPI001C9692F0|nr:restriction endonuclease [Streptomyces cavourensis]